MTGIIIWYINMTQWSFQGWERGGVGVRESDDELQQKQDQRSTAQTLVSVIPSVNQSTSKSVS